MMGIQNPADEYVRASIAPLFVQRIVCRELLIGQPESRPQETGIATLSSRIKDISGKVAAKRREYEFGSKAYAAGKIATNLTMVGWTAGLAAVVTGPVGVSIMAISGAAKVMLSDAVWDHAIKKRDEKVNASMNAFLRQQFEAQGITKSQLEAMQREGLTPKQIHERLIDRNRIFGDGGSLADWDEKDQPEFLYQMTRALDAKMNDLGSIMDTRLDTVEEDIAELQRFSAGMAQYAMDNRARIEAVERSMAVVQHNLSALRNGLKMLDGRVSTNETHIAQNARDIGFLQHFVYEGLDPDQQIEALNSGFFKGLEEADREKLKAKAEAAQARKELIGTFNELASGFALAGELGHLLDVPPDVQKAIGVAGTAFQAASALASGNYIGAAMSVVGHFKKDPAAERHKQVMETLGHLLKGQQRLLEGQQKIYKAIGQSLKNQQRIFEAVAELGKFVQEAHKEVMDKLDRIHENIGYVRVMISEQARINLDKGHSFIAHLKDATYNGLATYADRAEHYKTYRSLFKACWDHCEAVFASPDMHANIAMASTEMPRRQGATKAFREQILQPALNFLVSAFPHQSQDQALSMLLYPSERIAHLATKFDDVKLEPAQQPAANLSFIKASLHKPVDPDMVLEYGEVICQLHGYHPLIRDDEQELIPFEELMDHPPANAKGKDLLPYYLRSLNLAIAQQALVAGDGIIPELYASLKAQDERAPAARSALKHNGLLRSNFAVYLTRQALSASGNSTVSYGFSYRGDFDMNPLFPEPFAGRINGKTLDLGDGIILDLPHPMQLGQGMLRHTPDTPQLLAMRRAVAETLMEYSYPEWSQEVLLPHELETFRESLIYSANV